MSAAEYIAGFFLIVIGFAVSELLRGSAELIRERHVVKIYWPYLLVIPFIFEILIFWFLWIFTIIKNDQDQVWSIFEVADISIQVIPWAFISYLIFPSNIKEGFDSRKFYFENAKLVIVIAIILNSYIIFRDISMSSGITTEIVLMIASLMLNVIMLINFERLHLIYLFATILLVNYFIFFTKPLVIM